MASLLKRGNIRIEFDQTIAYCVLFRDTPGEHLHLVTDQCFHAEGLAYDREAEGTFQSGWSFSVLKAPSISPASWEILGLMCRLQCEWFTTRINRDFCLRAFGQIYISQSVGHLVREERQNVLHQR